MKRCAIYTRKSTTAGLEQDFNSLDAQREACQAYIKSQAHAGWQVPSESYDDGGFTGKNTDRPAFQRLMAAIEAGAVDVVVVYKVDRLSRSLLDFARVMDQFNRRSVAFVSVTQNFSTADAMGRLTLNMLMSFAEFEREMIAERTRDKIAAARRRGKWTGGPVPLGFQVVERRLVRNDLEALVVREAFTLYLELRSTLAVARELNRRGRPVRQNKRSGIAPLGKWTKSAVVRHLRNPLYVGLVALRGELHAGEHEAIVERETFDQVQELLDGGVRRDGPGKPSEYLLRGVAHCALCGAHMTPASAWKRRREYRYYRCAAKITQGAATCPSKPISAGLLEEVVVKQLLRSCADPGLRAEATARLRTRIEQERQHLVQERKTLPGKLAKASADASGLADQLASATAATRPLLEERLAALGEQIAATEARLGGVEERLAALARAEVDVGWVERALEDFSGVFDLLPLAQKQQLVRALVERVEVDRGTGQLRIHLADLAADAVAATA